MAGKIKELIDLIVEKRSQGDSFIASSTRTKIILQGISIRDHDSKSPDDPEIINKLKSIAHDFGITI